MEGPGSIDESLDPMRELKLRVPQRLQILLRVAKVTTGRPIASLVEQALTEFFERNPELARLPKTN